MWSYVKRGWRNLRDHDAGPATKAKLLARNLGQRFKGNDCCGHPGEPGC